MPNTLGRFRPESWCAMHRITKKSLAWGIATLAAISFAGATVAAADNLSLCPSYHGCLFRDANYWNLQATGAGGGGPWNIPVDINDSASSYANKSGWVMTLYTDTASGGTCGAWGGNSKNNLFWPFQDSVSSWSMRAGGC